MKSPRFDSFARAAMLGLLAATQGACTGATSPEPDGGSDEADEDDEGSGGNEGSDDDDSSAAGGSTGGESGEDAMGASGGVGGAEPVVGVTSSKVIANLSLVDFIVLCDEAGGVVETHAHCGGVVSGKGFSYDSDTDVFTEHTCAGFNTCTGFSCVLDD